MCTVVFCFPPGLLSCIFRFAYETWNLPEVLDLVVANNRLCFISDMKSTLNTNM